MEPVYVIIPTTPERKDRLKLCIDAINNSTYKPTIVCTYENTLGGCVEPQLKAIENIHGIAFIVNDDMLVEPDCIDKLYNSYKKGLLLQPDDSIHGGLLATSPFAHTDTLKKYIYPGYKHNFSDSEMTDRSISDGVYLYVPEAKLKHIHYTGRPELYDSTYEASQSFLDIDRTLYLKRKQNNYE